VPKILVIDDDPDLVESMRIVLESADYQVIAAQDAVTGLERARAEKPDAIVLGVMMPQGDEGFHLVWKLRQDEDPEVRRIPVLVVTALHERTNLRLDPEISDSTYAPGEYLPVQGFVDKPIQPEELLKRVSELVRGRQSR